MGLDVYVMPIWKFKAGDFSSPLERLGVRPNVISPAGVAVAAGRPGWIDRWKAKRATRSLRRQVEAEIGHAVRWNEDGGVECPRRSGGFEALRAYAKWLDYRDLFPTFDPPPDGNYYNHPAMSGKLTRPLTYPQLVNHSCFSGYFIPTELDRVVWVEPFTSWGGYEFKNSVGSTYRLLAELDGLGKILGIDESYGGGDADPLTEVKYAFAQLLGLAKTSREKDLPIVFHG